MKVEGRQDKGRPRKTWLETVNQEKKDWKVNGIDPASRIEWRNVEPGTRATCFMWTMTC